MQRAKIRKVVAAMSPALPDRHVREALALIHNGRTRQRVEARIFRRNAAR